MLKWLREHHCPWDELTCSAAAAGGHLEDGTELGTGAPLPVECPHSPIRRRNKMNSAADARTSCPRMPGSAPGSGR